MGGPIGGVVVGGIRCKSWMGQRGKKGWESQDVCEVFNKTMGEGKNVLASNWRSKHFMTTITFFLSCLKLVSFIYIGTCNIFCDE